MFYNMGRRPPGCPSSSFNDVAVRDCQLRCITKQIALEGQDLPRTYLAHHELESVIIIVIISYALTLQMKAV